LVGVVAIVAFCYACVPGNRINVSVAADILAFNPSGFLGGFPFIQLDGRVRLGVFWAKDKSILL
jgi:hypothetical protein